ncbi:PspC domain-containing protein [Aggregicoccus sp. 17bor-14]|uniref:PspC domain-containing protein n=1 Tax=Myxococcaceae TaxID=31 RepID=UPI00129C1E83|nr:MULTISPECIES: PspC domain-containing protein [Myxococcaceae]MBF5046209.1 PspC domain-containing protein [Simulacricoccus sp. 17bor-14]MRI91933.1 PspC domain-containing protein [Aggregicoccus sp. 17bor-14]
METTKRCSACALDLEPEATTCPHCHAVQGQTAGLHRGGGRTLAGVCTALARQFGLDAALVQIAFVVGLAFSGGLFLSIYFLLWVLTPPNATGRAPAKRLMDWLGNLTRVGPAVAEPQGPTRL